MITPRLTRAAAALGVTMLFLAACGGGSDDQSDAAEDAVTTDTVETTDAANDDSDDDSDDDAAPATTESADASGSDGDFEPGDTQFRVVNVLDDPVDIYVRTSGLVEAFAIESGVAPGAVTELAAPPSNGVYLVTEAGAGDPTCVSGCDHFIAELSAFEGEGPIHTVLLYTDERGEPSAFDLWEQPAVDNTSANAMPPADAASGFVVVTAIAMTDTDFGLRIAFDGTPGCLEPFNLENILIGGNQTPAFVYDGDSADFVIHGNDDRECAEEPVGGPFTVDGGPGERSHMILTGSPGDIDATVVAMISTDGTTASGSGGEDAGTSADRDFAVEQMTLAVSTNLPLDDAQSACTAELLVDAIGADNLVVDGEFVDLDALPVEFDPLAEQAIIAAVTECDIDPALLGG